jgi:hypothetical protein
MSTPAGGEERGLFAGGGPKPKLDLPAISEKNVTVFILGSRSGLDIQAKK